MKSERILSAIALAFIALFTYTAFSKILAFETFTSQMLNQALPQGLEHFLVWTIPPVEIITAILLLSYRTRNIGFIASFILMLLFTGYITLVLFNFYERVPCSCGGVLENMTWQQHFYFNLFFLLLSIIPLMNLYNKKILNTLSVGEHFPPQEGARGR